MSDCDQENHPSSWLGEPQGHFHVLIELHAANYCCSVIMLRFAAESSYASERARPPSIPLFAEGRSAALLHPIVMGSLFVASLYSAYLGYQWKRTRETVDEIRELKRMLPAMVGDVRPPSPLDAQIVAKEAVSACSSNDAELLDWCGHVCVGSLHVLEDLGPSPCVFNSKPGCVGIHRTSQLKADTVTAPGCFHRPWPTR